MIFIDASAYLSILIAFDVNHRKAIELFLQLDDQETITSQAVLGEVLTVGSQRYDREITIQFVDAILKSKTIIVYEDYNVVKDGYRIFKLLKQKNIGWVDCYSFAIMKKYGIAEAFTFDQDFKKSLSKKI